MEQDIQAVRKWFPTATIRVVPAGHGVRYQVVATEPCGTYRLSSHLCLSEASAWTQARRKVAEMTRVIPRTRKSKAC